MHSPELHNPSKRSPTSLMKQFLRARRGSYALAILSIIVSEVFQVQFPHILGNFTDALHAHRLDAHGVVRYIALLFLVGIVSVLLYAIGQVRNGVLGREFEYQLRKKLFAHWELLSVSYFRNRSIGDLLNHAMTDVRQVREALSGGLNILTNAIFLLIATLYMTFRTVSVKLTLVSIIPLLFVPLFVIWWAPRIRRASRDVQESLSDMADLTEESLTAIRLIKATANEPVERARFAERVHAIVRQQIGLFRKSALFQSMIPLMGSLSFAIALLYGGYLTLSGDIRIGSFVAFTLYLAMFMQPLQQIGFVFNNFQRASASMARLEVLLGEQPDIVSPAQPLPNTTLGGDIEVRLDEYRYADAKQPTLRNIAFSVKRGQTLGIVGRTGSGKTTLVNLLPRLFDPPPHTVFVDGCDVREVSLQVLRDGMAYVPQDGFLFSTTIGENIGFADEHATRETIAAAAEAARIATDIADFPNGYETLVGERGVTLSGGQRQRTAIARAFVKDAPILIMDDSLSAVDMQTEKEIIEALRHIRRGKTTVIIAHRLSAVRHADFILVLEQGTIVEQGTHDALLAKGGVYAKTFEMQEAGEAASG